VKLNEFNQDIAAACDARPKLVSAIQKETFRRLLAALDKGERISIPEFGVFTLKEIAAEEGEAGKKLIRFRRSEADVESSKEGKEDTSARKEARRQRRAKAAESAVIDTPEETSVPEKAGE
jgi:nucleoid DNA-binding protein